MGRVAELARAVIGAHSRQLETARAERDVRAAEVEVLSVAIEEEHAEHGEGAEGGYLPLAQCPHATCRALAAARVGTSWKRFPPKRLTPRRISPERFPVVEGVLRGLCHTSEHHRILHELLDDRSALLEEVNLLVKLETARGVGGAHTEAAQRDLSEWRERVTSS